MRKLSVHEGRWLYKTLMQTDVLDWKYFIDRSYISRNLNLTKKKKNSSKKKQQEDRISIHFLFTVALAMMQEA